MATTTASAVTTKLPALIRAGGPPTLGSVWRGLLYNCFAPLLLYCFTASCLLLIALVLDGIPEGDFLGEESEEWTPTLRLFLKRGDDGEWARVKMVRVSTPFVIFAKAEIQKDSQQRKQPTRAGDEFECVGKGDEDLRLILQARDWFAWGGFIPDF